MDEKDFPIHLFERYKQVHSEGKSDDDIETVSTKAKEYLTLKKYFDKPKTVDFYRFTEEYIECTTDKDKRLECTNNKDEPPERLNDLHNIYRKLEDYGLRLVKRPWRKEFHTIKLFTTFFKYDIASNIPSAVQILYMYGYKDVPHNMLKMDSHSLNSDRIFLVCFDLFLSRIEVEVMNEVCDSLHEYTNKYTLTDVFMARRNTRGDASKALESYLKENPNIKAKRMKTDDTEAMKKSREKFEESHKFPVEDEEMRKSDVYKRRMARTTRDTKYPPSANYYNLPSGSDQGFPPVTSSAKVKHISSSVPIDNFSDAALYEHSDASTASGHKETNIPMDTQEAQPRSEVSYDATLYEDMNYSHDTYEYMYSQDTGDSSCTTLPPPPGIPPPTYDQAAQIPGNDWVYLDHLSNNISAMNIDENGYSQVMGVRGVDETADIRGLKDRVGLKTSSYSKSIYYQAEPQATSTKAREVKGLGDVSSERQLLNGSYQDYKTPTTSFTKDFEKTLPEKSALYRSETSSKGKTDLQRTSSLGSPEKKATSKAQEQHHKDRLVRSGSKELSTTRVGDLNSPAATMKVNERHIKDRLARSGPDVLNTKRISDPSVSIATSKGYEQHVKDRLARSEPDVLNTKRISDPTATLPYSTSSYSKGSSTYAVYSYPKTHEMTTRSQTKAAAARKPDYLSESLQGTGTVKPTQQTMAERTKEGCIVCSSKATHYCQMCKKRACKSCTTVVTRLPCDSYKEHLLVEEIPTTTNEKADLGSKGDCSFCGVTAASQSCIICDKKSCATCSTVYTKDPCVMDSNKTHYFVNQQQQKTADEPTASQKETTASSKGKKPNPAPRATGENYCDFCALAADLICKDCLKTICTNCIHVYTQDLCPRTKREHHFENITEQSSNANKTTEGSSWSCERCTFLNSPSHRICAVCATSRGVNQVDMPKSGSRKCQNCTFANEEGATICRMCSRTFGLENPESYI